MKKYKHILVAGGAGYIGSHACKSLSAAGYIPVAYDNLSYGHKEAVKWGPFVKGAIEDSQKLESVIEQYKISAVMHFAAFCYVGESVTDPAKYYQNNVANTLNLLKTMIKNGVNKFIFSSTCATYGEPEKLPLTEKHPQNPISPYGRTKLIVEQILDDFKTAYGLKSISLRYFNAAGADLDSEIGEDHEPETHLIPLILKTALGQRKTITLFGDDYPTEDGTCIRDYIHINDLAQAHILALEKLFNGSSGDSYNLGNGNGYSVKQVIDAARKITGRPILCKIDKRREGDPAILIGASEKAIDELGWKPQFADLDSIIETAWKWHKKNPHGFKV